MLWGGSKGGLEVRTSADGSTVLRGRFPYAIPTVLSDGREKRREVFEAPERVNNFETVAFGL